MAHQHVSPAYAITLSPASTFATIGYPPYNKAATDIFPDIMPLYTNYQFSS
jgi:hypothetical protein